MIPIEFKDSIDSVDLFFKHHKQIVSKYVVELFLVQHSTGHSFQALQDFLKTQGFRDMLISYSFDDIRELPLPVFVQSNTGFFYLLDLNQTSDCLLVNNKEISQADFIEKFKPLFLLSERIGKKRTLNFMKHPFSTKLFQATAIVFALVLFLSLFLNVTSFLALLGIGICLLAFAKDLVDGFDQGLLKFVCTENKLMSCQKDNSMNSIVMPVMGLSFFSFVFLCQLVNEDLRPLVVGSFFFGLLVIGYSLVTQFRYGKLCQLCLIIISIYLLLNYLIYFL